MKGRALAPASAASLAPAPALALTPALAFALLVLMLPLCSCSNSCSCSGSYFALRVCGASKVLKGRDDFGRIRPNVLVVIRGVFNKREKGLVGVCFGPLNS